MYHSQLLLPGEYREQGLAAQPDQSRERFMTHKQVTLVSLTRGNPDTGRIFLEEGSLWNAWDKLHIHAAWVVGCRLQAACLSFCLYSGGIPSSALLQIEWDTYDYKCGPKRLEHEDL